MALNAGAMGTVRLPDPENDSASRGNPDAIGDLAQRAAAWCVRLDQQLQSREARTRVLRAYYDGDQPVQFATRKWRDSFGSTFGQATDNWCRIVIDTATERMPLIGFSAATGSEDDGAAAMALWTRNGLHIDADVAHTDALVTGQSYILVTQDEHGAGRITVEDPLQTIVEHDPADRGRRLAGLKRWRDLDGAWQAQLMTPDHIWRFTRGAGATTWRAVDEPAANPLGVVPLIPLVNAPDVYGRGHSDLEPILPLQDASNKLLGDLLIASEFAAYPQRVLLGVEVPVNPATGEPDQNLVGGINRWLAIEDPAAKVQELAAADLGNYTRSIELLVQHIAALSRTPPHYLLGQMANLSGDALAAAESGLVSRVRRRTTLFGAAWAEAITLAAHIDGAPRLAVSAVWGNPERISDVQRADAAVKLAAIGVPQEQLWAEYGYSPSQISRLKQMQDRQARLDGVALGVSDQSGSPPEPPAPPAE
ncbi:MAG: phage portal protein [Patulibacter sp.]